MTRIVTVTLNPAVDLACSAEHVVPTHKIRTVDSHIDPGGGGINVARVLHVLGADTLALVVAGGATGALIEDLLREAGVPHETIPCHGRTRISFTVFERATRQEYRFVPLGPTAEPHDWTEALARLEQLDCGWIVASGSLEPGMPPDIYATMARLARRRGIGFVLDSSGPPLRAALEAGVDLVKPSLRELESLVGHALTTPADQDAEAMALVRSGHASRVAVTLGEAGALLASAEGVIRLPAVPVPFGSAVGAGDSFVAGMTWALSEGAQDREALEWGIASGTAAVAKVGTARVRREDVVMWHDALRARIDGGPPNGGAQT
jgi:6-phosphofructokinase 2